MFKCQNLICYLVLICLPATGQTSNSGCADPPLKKSISVEMNPQVMGYWCWAASGQMCMKSQRVDVMQCDEASKYFSNPDCCKDPESCNNGGWPPFKAYGFRSQRTKGVALTWDQLVEQIYCKKKAVAFSWHWKGTGGHMMVAYGYSIVNGVKFVSIRDPLPVNKGESKLITYASYVSAGDHTHWDDFYDISQ